MKNIILKITIPVILACSINVDIFCQASDDVAKAVAFEKLTMFISWPPSATIKDSSGIFIIVVFKNKTFSKNLENVYRTHQIKNKNVQIVYLDNIQELKKCDLLYISNSSTNELKTILSSIHGKPILTIADKEGFAEAGCFINLYESESKLRFEINQKGMQDAGFKIDYRLLRVSKVLNPVIE